MVQVVLVPSVGETVVDSGGRVLETVVVLVPPVDGPIVETVVEVTMGVVVVTTGVVVMGTAVVVVVVVTGHTGVTMGGSVGRGPPVGHQGGN